MKKMLSLILCCLILIPIVHIRSGAVYAAATTSEILMETSSGRVLYENNADEARPMASTTKILTALIAAECCNPDDVVTIPKSCVGVEGSSVYLEEGEKLTVKELLYGLMLRSGNDCAEALACHISGSVAQFAERMNQRAVELGAEHSHFTNPHGLPDDDHYTTARDLAKIAAFALGNPLFKEVVSTRRAEISWASHEYNRVLINKNKMLSELEGATGIKTGYTKKAGRCLVTSCERNAMELVCVVLNCGPMFERSKELLNGAFSDYQLTTVYRSSDVIDFIPVEGDDEPCGIYIKNDIRLPLTTEERKTLKIVYDYPDQLVPPFKKDHQIGEMKIYASNKLIFSEKIYTIIGK